MAPISAFDNSEHAHPRVIDHIYAHTATDQHPPTSAALHIPHTEFRAFQQPIALGIDSLIRVRHTVAPRGSVRAPQYPTAISSRFQELTLYEPTRSAAGGKTG
ncbi:hypothetical protein HWV62_5993 [Athelia sp. TMB]|nr:hypothetical protein HWV62_5993 [Athelia sp. TMB]